jgi:hypothetical protein
MPRRRRWRAVPEPRRGEQGQPRALVGAVICSSIVVLAVLFGIVVIIFGKQLFGT